MMRSAPKSAIRIGASVIVTAGVPGSVAGRGRRGRERFGDRLVARERRALRAERRRGVLAEALGEDRARPLLAALLDRLARVREPPEHRVAVAEQPRRALEVAPQRRDDAQVLDRD